MTELSLGSTLCARGHRLAPEARRCHVCWGRVALALPKEIGPYEILGKLGQGAHGEVFKARQRGAGKLVALKVITQGEPEREIRQHVQLRHPHIVSLVDGAGMDHEPPYFAMELVEGGTLANRKAEFNTPTRAMELMMDVAHAIESAHQHLVLHRDLKPTNILIDRSGRAFVSDFSVAKRLDGPEPAKTATFAGTLPYMSPEQAGIISAPVSTASDVYGLGAILYELLTGGPPRPVDTLQQLRASFAADDLPKAIRRTGVCEDLNAVCMRALRKDRNERYTSAAEFAADLRRILHQEWLPWRRPSVGRRIERWVRTNRWLAASIALGALLLTTINIMSFRSVSVQQAELQQVMLRANASLAKAQAQAALAELIKFKEQVAAMVQAAEPVLQAALKSPRDNPYRPELKLALPGFDSLFVAGCDGFIRAHSFDDGIRALFPRGPPGYFERNYRFRDYFRGALALAQHGSRDVYISRAFRSTWDARIKFAFSTPIYASHGAAPPCVSGTKMVGVFFAARSASSTLGELQIPELEGSGQRTALFGPRDRDSADAPLPPASAYHVVVHEKLRLGDERRLDPRLAARLNRHFGQAAAPGQQFQPSSARPYRDSDYVDTLDDSHARWLGGFYPVGKTGFVIGVQTAYGTATAPVRRMELLALLNLGFLLFCMGAFWLSLRRRSART